MPYLIDGHNLIPKIAGMSLRQLDDEERLVLTLQNFCRIRRQAVEVFFDGAPPARAGRQVSGQVVIRWVRQGKTADQAILDRLGQLRKAARNWTVVSSDRQVQAGARDQGASLLSAEEFALLLRSTLVKAQSSQKEEPSPSGPAEIEEWLKIFKQSEK